MALNFPSSPTTGQTYTSGNATYTYDGTKWILKRKKYSYKGTRIDSSNTVSLDLSSGNFFDVYAYNDLNISFTNPPSANTSQYFNVKLNIDSSYPYTTYNISKAFMDQGYSLPAATYGTDVINVHFKTDGTVMYILSFTNATIYSFLLSAPWDISTAVTSYTSLSVSAQDAAPRSMFFRPDGLKLFVLGQTSQYVYSYTLSSPWDVSTAVYDNYPLYIGTQLSTVGGGMAFKSDGTKLYIHSVNTSSIVFEYNLPNAWSLIDAEYNNVFKTLPNSNGVMTDMFFSPDGTAIYALHRVINCVSKWTLSTPWNITTATITSELYYDEQDPLTRSLKFSSDGTKMFILGDRSDTLWRYTCVEYSRINWTNNIVWDANSAPQAPEINQTDVYRFITSDSGSTYFGKKIQDNIVK